MLQILQTPDGGSYLDISELRALSASQNAYYSNTANDMLQNQLYTDLLFFLDFCIQYANNIFRGATYTFDHVAPQLFLTKFRTAGQYASYLRYALYAAKLYAEKLRADLQLQDMINCKELILVIMSDYEWLLKEYENNVLNNNVTVVCHGSRRSMSPMDLKFGANQLMFMEQTGSLSQVDYRNTKPVVMFVIRQCLEVLGKNLIGFDDIVDQNGNSIHQFTQVAWTFLHDMERQNINVVNMPMRAVSIHTLNSWTNSYVHNPYIYASYIQFYALELLYEFSRPTQAPVTIYDGTHHQSYLYGNYQIPSYTNMKQAFETYLRQVRPNLNINVNWLQPNDVGAYILQL